MMCLLSNLVGMNLINRDFTGKDSLGPPSSAKLLTYNFVSSMIRVKQ